MKSIIFTDKLCANAITIMTTLMIFLTKFAVRDLQMKRTIVKEQHMVWNAASKLSASVIGMFVCSRRVLVGADSC